MVLLSIVRLRFVGKGLCHDIGLHLKKTALALEPCTCVWQIVQAWYWTAWLWNDGISGALKLSFTVWHCRQSVFTLLLASRRAFCEPCGEWHEVHPSTLTGGCSNTNGPA